MSGDEIFLREANFPRRDTALTILSLLHSIVGFSRKNFVATHLDLTSTVTPATANTLLALLHDSYELNKERALAVLCDFPPNLLNLDNPDDARQLLETAVRLMTSCKPPDSVTAGYIIQLLLTAPAGSWVMADVLGMARSDTYSVKLMTAVYLRNKLAEQVAVAEASLVEAAGSAAMYGTLAVLRGVYQKVGRDEYEEEWENIT